MSASRTADAENGLMRRRPAIALLGLLTAIDAVAIDSYIPALPAIQREFATDASAVQSTLAVFFIGIAVGQAFWGPASDRLGRRAPLLWGLVAYAAGSLLSTLAPDLLMLMVGRFVQAIGASAGLVLARAVVSDLWPDDAAARLYSIMMQILGLTAMVSPLIGGGILMIGSWRLIFALLALVGLGCLLWTWFALEESLPRERRARGGDGAPSAIGGYVALMKQPPFLWAVTTSAFAMGTMFAMIAGGAFVFVGQLGWSTTAFSLLYGATSVAFILVCQLNNMLLQRHSAERVMALGLVIQLVLSALFLIAVLAGWANGLVVATIMILSIGVLGIILGNAVAEAMRLAPAVYAGSASALVGVAQFVLSAIVTPLSTAHGNFALSVAAVMLGCALIAWISARRAARYPREGMA